MDGQAIGAEAAGLGDLDLEHRAGAGRRREPAPLGTGCRHQDRDIPSGAADLDLLRRKRRGQCGRQWVDQSVGVDDEEHPQQRLDVRIDDLDEIDTGDPPRRLVAQGNQAVFRSDHSATSNVSSR